MSSFPAYLAAQVYIQVHERSLHCSLNTNSTWGSSTISTVKRIVALLYCSSVWRKQCQSQRREDGSRWIFTLQMFVKYCELNVRCRTYLNFCVRRQQWTGPQDESDCTMTDQPTGLRCSPGEKTHCRLNKTCFSYSANSEKLFVVLHQLINTALWTWQAWQINPLFPTSTVNLTQIK